MPLKGLPFLVDAFGFFCFYKLDYSLDSYLWVLYLFGLYFSKPLTISLFKILVYKPPSSN
jgi:hypothetical protein